MRHPLEQDVIGSRNDLADQTEGLGLFEAVRADDARATIAQERAPRADVSTVTDRESEDRTEAIARLKRFTLDELLQRAEARLDRAESPGVTADDVVGIAKQSPFSALLGTGQRAWSWVGPWMASLAREGHLSEYVAGGQIVRRRSTRPGTHGNLGIVYLHPRDRRAIERAA